MKHRGFIAIIFLIGCATGSVASHLVVPSARAGTAATRWEHVCDRFDDAVLTEQLNKAGEEGWELVSVAPAHQTLARSVDAYTACMKRALP